MKISKINKKKLNLWPGSGQQTASVRELTHYVSDKTEALYREFALKVVLLIPEEKPLLQTYTLILLL